MTSNTTEMYVIWLCRLHQYYQNHIYKANIIKTKET